MEHHQFAESDINAAVNAIHEEFRSAAAITDCKATKKLLEDCATSFTSQIRSYVTPLPDEEYDSLVVVADENKMVVTDTFEDDELLDTAAHSRVRELRAQVRERAAAIHKLRESTIRRPAEIVERHFQLVQMNSEQKLPTTDEEKRLQSCRENIDDLKTNGDRMASLLIQAQSEIPSQLKLFQDTLSAVEKGLIDGGSRIDDAIKNRFDGVCENTAEEFKTMSYPEIAEKILSRGLS